MRTHHAAPYAVPLSHFGLSPQDASSKPLEFIRLRHPVVTDDESGQVLHDLAAGRLGALGMTNDINVRGEDAARKGRMRLAEVAHVQLPIARTTDALQDGGSSPATPIGHVVPGPVRLGCGGWVPLAIQRLQAERAMLGVQLAPASDCGVYKVEAGRPRAALLKGGSLGLERLPHDGGQRGGGGGR